MGIGFDGNGEMWSWLKGEVGGEVRGESIQFESSDRGGLGVGAM
jgi:hypothetical protein